MTNLKWLSPLLLVLSSVINLSIQRSSPIQDEKELVPLLEELSKAYEQQESKRPKDQTNQYLYGTNNEKIDKQREKHSPAISTKQKIKEKRLKIPQQYNLREEYEKFIKRINNKYRHLQDLTSDSETDLTKRVFRCGCSGKSLQLRCGCGRQGAETEEPALEKELSRAIQEVLYDDENIRYELRCRCQGRSQSLRCGCNNIKRSNDMRSRTNNGNDLEDLRCGCKGLNGQLRCGCSRNRDDVQLRAMLALDEGKEDLVPTKAVATNTGGLRCGCGGRRGYLKCGCSRGRDNEETVEASALEKELMRAITAADDDAVLLDLRCGCQGRGKVLRCGCEKGRVKDVQRNELSCNCIGKNGLLRCECSKIGKAFDIEDDLAKLLSKVDDIDLVHVKNAKEVTVCQSGQCYDRTLFDTDYTVDGRRDLVDHDEAGTLGKGEGMAFNDFLNYFVHMDRNVLKVVRSYIYNKKDVSPPPLPEFVNATQKTAIEFLRNSIKKHQEKGLDQHLIQKRLEQVFFGDNVINSVRPHSFPDQHAVYIPKDLYEQIDRTKDDKILRSPKIRFPLTKNQLNRKIKKKLIRNGTEKSQVFWRRHVFNDHMAYGFPFEMEVEGLGQINV